MRTVVRRALGGLSLFTAFMLLFTPLVLKAGISAALASLGFISLFIALLVLGIYLVT